MPGPGLGKINGFRLRMKLAKAMRRYRNPHEGIVVKSANEHGKCNALLSRPLFMKLLLFIVMTIALALIVSFSFPGFCNKKARTKIYASIVDIGQALPLSGHTIPHMGLPVKNFFIF